MILRRIDANGEPVFGHGMRDFLKDADAVPQKVRCRLLLIRCEFFLDISAGVPWIKIPGSTDPVILGEAGALPYAESVIKSTIMATTGVRALEVFGFSSDHGRRAASVSCEVASIYGPPASVEVSFP